jgi:hypothetical protein
LVTVAVEITYRVYLYRNLQKQIMQSFWPVLRSSRENAHFSDMNNVSEFDLYTGHRYWPNITVSYKRDAGPAYWQTNRYGHIGHDDYTVEKPEDVYRIAVIGDSFTANVTNSTLWTDHLRNRLNKNACWYKYTGGKRTEILNLSRDGVGIIQFKDIFEKDALLFNPDMILVNMISDDITRGLYYRGNIGLPENHKPTLADVNAVRRKVFDRVAAQFPWFTLRPIFLMQYAGPWFGISPYIDPTYRMLTPDKGAEESVRALRTITLGHSNVLILHHPMAIELLDNYSSLTNRSREANERYEESIKMAYRLFINKWGSRKIFQVKDYLPKDASNSEIASWYMLPFDDHPSNYGLEIYAGAVGKLLSEQFCARTD